MRDGKRRYIYAGRTIPDMLIEPLKQILKEQADNSLLFPSRAGTPISPRNLVRQFKELLTDAELPGTIRFYDLRHTAASFALAEWDGHQDDDRDVETRTAEYNPRHLRTRFEGE
jgi:integrase